MSTTRCFCGEEKHQYMYFLMKKSSSGAVHFAEFGIVLMLEVVLI